MGAGRPPSGVALVDRISASQGAKRKLRLFLQTLFAGRSVVEASQLLGISETAFYAQRSRWFLESAALLEPRKIGRPRKERPEECERIEELEGKVRVLRAELYAQEVREELQAAIPHLRSRKGRVEGGPRVEKKTRELKAGTQR